MSRYGEWREHDITPYRKQKRKRYWRQHVLFNESDWQGARRDAKSRASRSARRSKVGSTLAVNFVAIICVMVVLFNVFGSLSFSKFRSSVKFDGDRSSVDAPLYHKTNSGDLVYNYLDPTLSRSSFVSRFLSLVDRFGAFTDAAYNVIDFTTGIISDVSASSAYLVCFNGSESSPDGSIYLIGIDGNWFQRTSTWFSHDVTHVYYHTFVSDAGIVTGKSDHPFSINWVSSPFSPSDFNPVKYMKTRYTVLENSWYLYRLYGSSGDQYYFLAKSFTDYGRALDYYNQLRQTVRGSL